MPRNPLQHLYDKQNHGTAEEKYRDLPGFPRIIDVELTNLCNYGCLFCPTGLGIVTRDHGFMTRETWSAIVSQCQPHGTALRIIGWGENTMHPHLLAFINEASRAGLLVHLNTNGSKITPEYAEGLVINGLASIKFSFQGVDQASYYEARRTDFFEGMLDAIMSVRAARNGAALPFIAASTSITYETPEMVETFRKRLEPLVDHLSVGRTIFDFLDKSAVRLRPAEMAAFRKLIDAETTEKKHPDPCPEVWDKLSIAWDGSGRVCCNDHSGVTDLGNVVTDGIASMWRHKTIEEYRARLANKEYSGPLCESCFDYQSLSQGAA